MAATASSAARKTSRRCDAASSGPPNSVMSAPAAKIRSPPVTTTAPGGSAVQLAAATAGSWREQRRRQRVHLRVVEGDDGDAVVAVARGGPGRASAHRGDQPEPSRRRGPLRRRARRASRRPPPTGRGVRASTSASQLVVDARRRSSAGAPVARAGGATIVAQLLAQAPLAPALELAARRRCGSRWSRDRRPTARRRPRPGGATVATIGGRQRRPGSDRSSICSRSRRVSSTPGRSALLITKTSAISISPALLACTASPQPGFTTTTVVSASPAISTSTWPTPTVSTSTQRRADGVEHPDRLGRGQREAAEVAPRRHRADEHAGVDGVVLHADPVAEDGAAGERRRRVDGQHRDLGRRARGGGR